MQTLMLVMRLHLHLLKSELSEDWELFLAADAAFAFGSWAFLFGIGGQIALFANFLGPIGIVAGALISAGLGIMKLFGGGWEKSVAKKLVNAYEEKRCY